MIGLLVYSNNLKPNHYENPIHLLAVILIVLASCKPATQQSEAAVQPAPAAHAVQDVVFTETHLRPNAPSIRKLFITARSGLSLRQGTNLKSEKILTIPYGYQVTHLSSPKQTTMTVAGIEGNMVEVNYLGTTGFVFSGYLSTLAPPLVDETATQYAKRLSSPEKTIKVSKIKNTKGDEFGLTTSITLPASSWGESYMLAQALFDIPKTIAVDLTENSRSTIVNIKKRLRTKTDEVILGRDKDSNINHITYSYSIRGYKRTVSIKSVDKNFMITEVEWSYMNL